MASSPPPLKKQRTTMGSTSTSGSSAEEEEGDGVDHGNIQAERDDDHLGNHDQVMQGDVVKEQSDDDLKYLLCDEVLQESQQVEVDGAHFSNIQVYIQKQLPALNVTNLDPVARASTVENMLIDTRYARSAHLAIQIFDRYYSEVDSVKALPAQKVSSTSLAIAIKHLHERGEESTQTTRGDEFQVLNVLKYHLNAPTLRKLVDACVLAITPLDNKLIRLCAYLTDLAMLDRDCTRYQITILAAGCLFLAQSIVYPNKVRKIRGLWECDSLLLKEVVTLLRDLYLKKRLPHCHQIRSKYSKPEWGGVANFPCPDTILEVVDF